MTSVNAKKYLFANWKMYLHLEPSVLLAREFKNKLTNIPEDIQIAVFPSALAFAAVSDALKDSPVFVGAQNTYWVPEGGYTGEVSAEMFARSGAQYALVGHSERRHQFHETNHEVRLKLEAALAAGLTPVLCVGETAAEHKNGTAREAVEVQVRSAYSDLAWPTNRPFIIAYEPVWAIGTGNTCSPVGAEKMAGQITNLARTLTGALPAVLYGGSVRPENVATFLAEPHLAGVLVGGASAKLDSWQAIVRAAVTAD